MSQSYGIVLPKDTKKGATLTKTNNPDLTPAHVRGQNSSSWADGPLLGFDTETTGVDVATDRVVTAALVRREANGDTQIQNWLINPGVPIPAEAAAIHGVSTAHAEEFGDQPAAALEEIAQALTAAARQGTPVVAFNATFDLCILDVELQRHGLQTITDRLGHELVGVIDPLVLDRSVDRFRKGKRKLVDLCSVYGVADPGNLHTADVDVLATLDVLNAIVTQYPQLRDLDLQQLHDHQSSAHRIWAENFNAWRQKQGFDGPGAGVVWLRDDRLG